ncbi:CHD3-type chromatin-remodeling factor CHR7-like [Brassica napus]|uniref:CHD3-type chromatin-remodeling factor CHR7-like n=1 Tax=Brassica napus TaxID=3708 RepID=UPI002078A9CE|nr:CHD3-type chromatin-remodeling factor CHR7-like [Brassica napus]
MRRLFFFIYVRLIRLRFMVAGKTIQSIAFLASLFEENLDPYLVVAPVSTLRNWEREFATWAPHMNVVMYCGNSQARTVIRDHEFYFPKGHNKMTGINGESKQERMKFDVILTSCEMINVDTEILKPIKWKCMIVDEGHRLKNKNSELFNSLKPYTSEHRVLVRKNLDDEAAVLEEAHAIENKSSTSNYLEDSLKDKYESQQVEELNVLGKRKRNHKQVYSS